MANKVHFLTLMPYVSDEILVNFNRLVYEYLLKMQYEKAAKLFKVEAQVGDVRVNDTAPVLLNWYNIFIETADVRSGKTYVPESLNRIEGIMLKLENDRQRYARMSAVVAPQRKSPLGQVPNYYDAVEKPYSHERPPLPTFPVEPHCGKAPQQTQIPVTGLKEYKRIDFNIPYIYTTQYCPLSRILINACADGKLYFYNLAKNIIEFSFAMKTRKTKAITFNETQDGIYLAYDIDKYSLFLFKYSEGRKNDIKTIESDQGITSYCFVNDAIAILYKNSILRIFSINGVFIRQFEVASSCYAVEGFGSNMLLIEQNRVVEFDYTAGLDVKIIIKGKTQAVHVKDGCVFAIYSDMIQVFQMFPQVQPFPICSLKSTIDCRDITFVFNTVAVCTGNDVYYSNTIFPAPNSIGVFNFSLQGISGLMTVSSDGRVTLMSCI